jgi:hypothetical protein
MKVIFFTPIPQTKRLATIITNESVKDLKLAGVIPSRSKIYSAEYDENNQDLMVDIYHVEYMKFDNYTSPKAIIPDIELYSMAVLEDIRTKRSMIFQQLDSLQVRALIAGRTDLVAEIEVDKKVLRDLPEHVQTSNCKSILDVCKSMPAEMYIDFEEKYAEKFKQQY